jgi:hypothetical protein
VVGILQASSQLRLCHGASMNTATVELLTPTEIRKNLSRVLARVSRGAKLGIVFKNEIFMLRPTKVVPDYVFEEYGITPEAMKSIAKKLDEETEEKIASGKTVRWTGDIKKLVRDRV